MLSSQSAATVTAAPARATIYSIQELADSVNAWCADHGVLPANGQASSELNERNIRYYRVRGLLDAPGSGLPHEGAARRGFTEKHAAQLRVIRLLQARGLPLERIQQEVAGRSPEELRTLERRELGLPPEPAPSAPVPAAAPGKKRPAALSFAATDSTAQSNGQSEASPSLSDTAPEPEMAAVADDLEDGQERWLVSTVSDDFLLVSRRGRKISSEKRRIIAAVLQA
ncbi:MAG: MerR family transcriptional regulator [Verrucomicrobia bacterium]|nr:MerR family transcriptional regulator [Verrucomicrobiota bacterium]MBV9658917.1 MerR family transcriptional regulator [Verrucomicrobiota bacterium]